ncbi:MAG: hypothetical protein LBN42_01200 [Oscillospiraceae bacterium]|jgi:hypothetical protein|nr:hypothetical protein [Oscillospiraceae bacterium]
MEHNQNEYSMRGTDPLAEPFRLINELHDLVKGTKGIPALNGKSLAFGFDKVGINDLLEELQESLPRAIDQASAIKREEREILARAKRNADAIVNKARNDAAVMVSQNAITADARRQAEDIITKAAKKRDAESARTFTEINGAWSRFEGVLETLLAETKQHHKSLLDRK